MNELPDKWDNWSDDQLREYEERLYNDEVHGADVWFERDQVLQEMNRRNMYE
jgi:hypothetical protein